MMPAPGIGARYRSTSGTGVSWLGRPNRWEPMSDLCPAPARMLRRITLVIGLLAVGLGQSPPVGAVEHPTVAATTPHPSDDEMGQTAPSTSWTGVTTTSSPEGTAPAPLGPLVPAVPRSAGPTAVFYVILLVTMPLITVASLTWLHRNGRYAR